LRNLVVQIDPRSAAEKERERERFLSEQTHKWEMKLLLRRISVGFTARQIT